MRINPIRLCGPWDEGFALDIHTLASTYMGDDAYGNPIFDTSYSTMGWLIHQFKYRGDHSKLSDIIELVKPFIASWKALDGTDWVLPVPPSKTRSYQPAQEIAQQIAELINASYAPNILYKDSSIESKGLAHAEKQKIQGSIKKDIMATRKHNILLVDDLYQSGTTLRECVHILRQDQKIKKIFVLTMTKTRKG